LRSRRCCSFARALGFAFLFVFGVRIAAVFMLVASTIGLRTGFLPRWLVLASYVCGLVFLFAVTYVEVLALLLPAWAAAVSVVILRAARRSG
jgi:prepilin signal peptidase PulO-like enzyme (type II secretory pathway)